MDNERFSKKDLMIELGSLRLNLKRVYPDENVVEEVFEGIVWNLARCQNLMIAQNMLNSAINLLKLYSRIECEFCTGLQSGDLDLLLENISTFIVNRAKRLQESLPLATGQALDIDPNMGVILDENLCGKINSEN